MWCVFIDLINFNKSFVIKKYTSSYVHHHGAKGLYGLDSEHTFLSEAERRSYDISQGNFIPQTSAEQETILVWKEKVSAIENAETWDERAVEFSKLKKKMSKGLL